MVLCALSSCARWCDADVWLVMVGIVSVGEGMMARCVEVTQTGECAGGAVVQGVIWLGAAD